MPIAAYMTRTLALALPLLAACAAAPTPAPIDPAVARARTLCADEHPLDEAARLSCESDRGRLVAAARPRRSPASGFSPSNEATVVVIAAPSESAGQGLVDYGRQLAAPPVRCTSHRMGYIGIRTTSCR